jgi:hypothetical protein
MAGSIDEVLSGGLGVDELLVVEEEPLPVLSVLSEPPQAAVNMASDATDATARRLRTGEVFMGKSFSIAREVRCREVASGCVMPP